MQDLFFVISHYRGDSTQRLLEYIGERDYVLYNRSEQPLGCDWPNVKTMGNYGFNISSYLDFIVHNYEDLPQRIAFVKSDVVPRHLGWVAFNKCICSGRTLAPVTDEELWEHIRFPFSYKCGDGFLYELNNSWYRFGHTRTFFSDFDAFYSTFFAGRLPPRYLRFAPGGNYVVSRDRIVARTRTYYMNLNSIMQACTHACESHYIERALPLILDPDVEVNHSASTSMLNLDVLREICSRDVKADSRIIHRWNSLKLRLMSTLIAN